MTSQSSGFFSLGPRKNNKYRVVASGWGADTAAPLGPVEIDTSSLWLDAAITKLTSLSRSLLNKQMLPSFIVAFEFCQFPRTAMIWHRLGINIRCRCKSHRVSTKERLHRGLDRNKTFNQQSGVLFIEKIGP